MRPIARSGLCSFRVAHRRRAFGHAGSMRTLALVVLTSLVSATACSSGPSKSESLQIFAAATTAMASAQSRAISDAQQLRPLRAPAELLLDFTGPCTLGGSVGVTG